MKSKAFCLALAFVVSTGPASANGLASSERSVHVVQTEPSRLYRAEWLSAYAPSQITSQDAELPLFTASTGGEPEADTAADDAAAMQISAALKAKVRAIVAFARAEARTTPDGSQLVGSRIRVRCSVRQVVAKQTTALPALMLSERAAAEPTAVSSTTVEACTVKLIQVRRTTRSDIGKRAFSIELPPLDETAP